MKVFAFSPRRFLSRLYVLACLSFLLFLPSHASYSQQATLPQYVVRSGDSLYYIALLFGTTVPAIQNANNLTDESIINVGQAIAIPGFTDMNGELRLYGVQPGDTLENIAYRLGKSIAEVTRLNRMVNPSLLYIGQNFIYLADPAQQPQEDGSPVWVNTTGRNYVVQPKDTPLLIASRYGLSKWEYAIRNGLTSPSQIFPGKQLLLPTQEAFSKFPSPIQNIHFSPARAIQGDPLEIRIDLEQSATISGKLANWNLNFLPYYGGNTQIALQGIYNLQEPDIYPFELKLLLADGQERNLNWRVRIVDGQRGTQSVAVPDDQFQKLSDTPNVTSEVNRIKEITTVFNPERYWSGKFSYPVELAIDRMTATFGDTRVYNGVSFNSFHGGIDFAGAAGAPILAPAPGIVRLAEGLFTRGNAVIIDHGWGVYTAYWHLLRIEVEPGQKVETGQQIGLIGSTGLSNGNHLHWEVWMGGNQIDPLLWMELDYP